MPAEIYFIVLLLLGVGAGIAGLDYVVVIDPVSREMCAGWQWFGIAVGLRRRIDLARVDRVVIAQRRLPVTGPGSGVLTARPVYPVWLMSGEHYVDVVLGWSPGYLEQANSGWLTRSRPPNFAVFRDWARYVAARISVCLDLTLVDEKTTKSYAADEVPGHWLLFDELSFDSHHQQD